MTSFTRTQSNSFGYERDYYKSPIYGSWSQMKTRCNNPNYSQYHLYGGRGIKVCERWGLFANFLEDMRSTWCEGLSLDRINPDGDYTPENCRWADAIVQNTNRRNTKLIEYQGESLTLPEWARRFGIKRSTLSMRYYSRGWDIERCLNTPVRRS